MPEALFLGMPELPTQFIEEQRAPMLPIKTFIVNVSSRCDLDCPECPVYNLEDERWTDEPLYPSDEVLAYTGKAINEHVKNYNLDEITLVLFGGEPHKLSRLKAQLLRAGQDRLFVCLAKNTPCDNNRAERDLRQLVLKRKRSFGSQTHRGATALATVLSICTTTWRIHPDNYFSMLASLAG